MDSSSNSNSSMGFSSRRSLGFIANAKKNKQSFYQFFGMTAVMLLSLRSLAQKKRFHNLQEDTAALRDERDQLAERMDKIKTGLWHEASLDSSGVFASRLRQMFGDAK